MISVEVPNDIADYKPKFMFGMTGKQLACVIITGGIILLEIKFLMPVIGDLAIVFMAIPAFIAACFGWGETFTPGHIPFEKYLKTVFVQTFVAPKTRCCKTVCPMIVPCDKYYEPVPDSELSPELLEAVNFVREKTGIVIDAEETVNDKKRKKQGKNKAKKYKKSALAVS